MKPVLDHVRRITLPCILGATVAAVAIAAAGPVGAQQSPIERAATAGRIRIIRPTRTLTGPPDLLVLKNGQLVEAWGLGVSGDRISFRTRDARGTWFGDSVSKTTVATIHIGRSRLEHEALEAARTTPVEPPRVEIAEEQPVRKLEVLSGKFLAKQGKFTNWTFSFSSELNKYYTFAEDATEYGQFMLRSYHQKPGLGGRSQENEVIAKGKYFLYAPGSIGNEDWVLNLSNVVYIENDISPRRTFFSDRLPDEVLIVKFSEDGRVMQLRWANHSGWQWTAPVQQTYYRLGEPPAVLGGASTSGRTASLLPPALRRVAATGEAAERKRSSDRVAYSPATDRKPEPRP